MKTLIKTIATGLLATFITFSASSAELNEVEFMKVQLRAHTVLQIYLFFRETGKLMI